jgi:outer membrane receptor for ferrienterochelin and colicins
MASGGAHAAARPWLQLTFLAAASSAAFAVRAQEAQPAPIRAEPVQQVEVRGTSTAYDPRRDDTASKIVVGHDELEKYGDTTVTEALKRVPGITIGGSGRGTEVRMRGLGNGYTQILIDGERAPAGFTIDSLSPDVIERIEVMRVANAEFSTQAIAGTINIVLRKAVKAGQRSVKLGYAHGSALDGPDAGLQLSDKRGPLSYSLAASASRVRSQQEPDTIEQLFDGAGRRVGLRLTDESRDNRTTLVNITRARPGRSQTATR